MKKFIEPMTKLVKYKVIKSGDVLEVFHYGKGYLKGFTINPNGKRVHEVVESINDIEDDGHVSIKSDIDVKDEGHKEIQLRSARRAANELRRIINSNVGQYGDITPKFLTLTFKDDIDDLDIANKMFRDFLKRLNYKLTGERISILKYSAVWELTKKGRVHYHVILYNMPYIPFDDLLAIWGLGAVRINKIDEVDNVGVYVSKYMSKPDERYLDIKYKGKKRYFSSRGLKKPMEITNQDFAYQIFIDLVLENIEPTYYYEYENEYLGLISSRTYAGIESNVMDRLNDKIKTHYDFMTNSDITC